MSAFTASVFEDAALAWPHSERQSALRRDYRDMGMMIFGEIPNFDRVMNILQRLEDEINGN